MRICLHQYSPAKRLSHYGIEFYRNACRFGIFHTGILFDQFDLVFTRTFGTSVLIGGASGIGYVLGPWGSYSIAFLIVAALVPLICTRRYNRVLYTIIAILSAAFVDLFGSIWMMVVSDIALVPALVAGFLPFIVLDVVKAVIAAQIVPQIRKIVR